MFPLFKALFLLLINASSMCALLTANREWMCTYCNEDLRAVEFDFFVKKDSSLMWEVAPGRVIPFKSNRGARRTFQGVKFVNWYCLGF